MEVYSYDDALQTSIEYYGGDELAARVTVDKYLLRNADDELIEKSPIDMHKRQAREFARIESKKFKNPLSYETILKYFTDWKIIPQGSPAYGIGNPYKYVSLSNCYVLNSPDDSYGGILDTDEQLIQISKRRGGVGIDLSNLRYEGSPTKNASRSSTGLVTFMERYSKSIREVGQDGRRGALMLTVSVHHPDVLKFAKIKNNDVNVTGANISVRLTNEFLIAVENNTLYEQRFPVDSKNPKFSRMVSAREVWMELIRNAHNRAEPGLLFWDRIIDESPADCYADFGFRTISTNPSLQKDTLVLTDKGVYPIGWLAENTPNIRVINVYDEWVDAVALQSGADQPLVKITFNNGQSVLCTEQHKWKIFSETISKKSINLIPGDKIPFPFNPRPIDNTDCKLTRDDGFKLGTQSRNRDRIPDSIWTGNHEFIAGFIDGLFSGEFRLYRSRIVPLILLNANKDLAEDIRKLLSFYGIGSTITKECGEYSLCVAGAEAKKFSSAFRLSNQRQQSELDDFGKHAYKNNHEYLTIRNVEKVDIKEDVYDIRVLDDTNTFLCEVGITGNCGELPLPEYDSCRLMVQNPFKYVMNVFEENAYFDYDTFATDAMITQRLMDDMIDLELESIQRIIDKVESDPEPERIKQKELYLWNQIYKKCEMGRRTGSGLTGIGDTLAGLGIKYDSDLAIETVEKIYKTFKLACYRSSVDMAKELGPFPIWDSSLEQNNPFLLRIRDEDPSLYNDMQKHGRRNMALLTTAPVGSKSQEAQVTSGIEPLFTDEAYIRRKKINPNDKNSRVDFVDKLGDRWQEFKVYHKRLEDWMRITGETDTTKSPYHKSCAGDLDWRQRVKLQAAAQRHVDHSISSTLNLPNDVSIEKVAEIYETAWKAGCKGITVYRDGCRTGVLVKNDETKTRNNSPKRPKTLSGDIHHMTIKGVKYYAIVGFLDGEPYEIFAGRNTDLSEGEIIIPKNVTNGNITKEKRGHYRVSDESGDEIIHITAGGANDQEEAIARLVSTNLRHGVPMEFVVHQLEKVKGDMLSFSKVLARVLKRYIKDNTKVSGATCPVCNQESLVYEEGCQRCRLCGASKCG